MQTDKDPKKPTARDKLLNVALTILREKGYSATTVDDLCAAAGVTKGAFFHYFAGKEDLGVAAASHWSDVTGAMFANADYHRAADPLDRILGYVALRRSLIEGAVSEFTCVVGTMVQEMFLDSPAIRDACADSIFGHAATLEPDFQATIDRYGDKTSPSAASLAAHTQTVLQGAFILAKAGNDAQVALDACDHLDRYIRLLFPGRRADIKTTGQQETPQ